MPGGDAASPAWEAVVGEKLNQPDRFLPQLFEADRGRLAYLLDVLSHIDPPSTALALDHPSWSRASAPDSLRSAWRRWCDARFLEWDVTTAPFVRPPHRSGGVLLRDCAATADAEGRLVPDLGSHAFWQKVFDESGGAVDTRTDIAWLADTIIGHPARERERRLELFSFTERVLASAPRGDETIAAAHGFGSYPVLMRTLEGMGISSTAV